MGEELGVYERWKLSSEKEYALARSMVGCGASAMAVSRKLSIPYSRAVKLHSKASQELFVDPPTRMDPEADSALKDDLTETLIGVIARCQEAVEKSLEEGKVSTRSYDKLLMAAAQLCRMRGYNAPVRSVNVEWKANALVSQETHDRIMADPELREAFLTLEEGISRKALGVHEEGGEP